jgi:signal transduction histidine kinase
MIFRFACRPVLFLAFAVAAGLAQAETVGTVEARLEGGGRTIMLTAPGLNEFRGGFAARVVIEGVTNVLSSDSGTLVGVNSYSAETTPYGLANVSSSTIRFEKEQIELLFRLDQIPGVPVVILQAGIRNRGDRPVRLLSVSPLAMDERVTKGGLVAPALPVQGSGRSRAMSATFSSGGLIAPALLGGFEVEGSPEKWVVTGLNNATPVVTTLDSLKANFFIPRRGVMPFTDGLAPEGSLELFEYGGCYRDDGVGFLFGPVGAPVAFVAAFFRTLGQGKAGLTLMADMSGVQIGPGQARWGQQVALFLEKPEAALARWDAWVAKTHGARTSQGALSGWSSWYFLEKNVTGQDVLAVAAQAMQSGGRLRPDVIQIDRGYAQKEFTDSLETNDRFPEGLPLYAGKIAATGARPGLKVLYSRHVTAALVAGKASQLAGMGYSYLKLGHFILTDDDSGDKTAFELYRDCYAQVRKAVGDSPYLLLNDWTQARAGLGFVDACRSGYEAGRIGVRSIIEEALRAYHLNGRWFAVDNDGYYMATELKDVSPVVGGWPLARTWISMVGLSCGAAFTSDPWNEERFKPYWRNVEVMTPPAREQTEVMDLCTSEEWPRLVGHVHRDWGDWTVALLWNPGEQERAVTLDFAQAGLDPAKRYAVWSFWDDRYLGVAEGFWTTPRLGSSASQHLVFTEVDPGSSRPVFIGSNLHIYCGAADLKRVQLSRTAMTFELTDAGAREGALFIYSRYQPVLKTASGCMVDGIFSAGENVWRISLHDRKRGVPQRIAMAIILPVTYQVWFWALIILVLALLMTVVWRYVASQKLHRQHALAEERARIARDLHDNMGADLSHIGLMAEQVGQQSGMSSAVREQAERIVTSAHILAGHLDAVVWATNPAHDTLEHLVQYLCNYAQGILESAGIQLRLAVSEELPPVPLNSVDRHNLFLAAKEAIHNVVKHSGATRVVLRIQIRDKALVVEIEDNGCGLLPGAGTAPGADGLRNMVQRLARIHGRCEYLSGSEGRGTIVRLTVLLGNRL